MLKVSNLFVLSTLLLFGLEEAKGGHGSSSGQARNENTGTRIMEGYPIIVLLEGLIDH